MSALDPLLRKRFSVNGGPPVDPERLLLNFIAGGASISDNPASKRSDLTLFSNWTLYTPVWSVTGGTFVLGNGTSAGRTRRVGNDQHFHLELLGGGTTDVSTGNIIFDLHGASVDASQLTSFANVPLMIYISNANQGQRQSGYVAKAQWTGSQLRGPLIDDPVQLTGEAVTGNLYGFYFSVPVI